MIKILRDGYDNSIMDMFAMDHGTAILMESPDSSPSVIVSTSLECDDYRSRGYKVGGTINSSDFLGTLGWKGR